MEILNDHQRSKIDESDDSFFYAQPKFVYHLDSNFRNYLKDVYKEEIKANSVIIDLMSSWDSYLPLNQNYKKVIGHGLNKAELEKNKSLDRYWIQNFNISQVIPIENQSIDYCLMVAAWQYLQYPEKITEEISRILKSDGKFLISFSNRAFWTKAPNIWTNSSEEERIDYIRSVLISNGFQEPKIIKKFLKNNISFLPFLNKDPFYCLIAKKESN